jgi:hypothetical protein
MDNPEKLATGTQDQGRRQTKNTIYVGHYYAQTYTSVFI